VAAIGLLLDTHTLLWWLFDDARLSPDAREAIMDPDRVVLVSSASAWEIATKDRLGKLPEAGDVPTRLPHYLRKAGFEVEVHPDGADLWDRFEQFRPSLIVTDYQMPRMDGITLIRNVRDHPAGRDVPVILLTGKGFELDEAGLAPLGGIVRLFPKPFSPRELLSTVESLTSSLPVEA